MVTPTQLDRAHRIAQLAVRAASIRDLIGVWPAFDLTQIARTWPAFEDAAIRVVRDRGRISAGLASRYYRQARREAGIADAAPAFRATPTTQEIIDGLRVMGPVNAARQLALGRTLGDVQRTTLVNLSGVVSKYTLDHGRDLLLNAIADDSRARGWKRSTAGLPCDFCAMLAGRGPVYRAESTAGFQAHRHCACLPVPVF